MTCTDSCVVCPFGYFNEGTKCTSCITSNCARCSNAATCTICKDGYYLASPTTCTKCTNGRAKCSSADFALSCASGYTSIETDNSLGSLNCVACTSPCKTCNSDPEQCDSCVSGYYL